MNDLSRLVQDIETEVLLTRSWLGKRRLEPKVMTAMGSVPRDEFVPSEARPWAYHNGPLPIGRGQTISQPFIVALMTDLLEPEPSDVVLEIGTGSGYQAAVLSTLVGSVYSCEIIPELAESARQRLARLGYSNVTVRQADGNSGWAEHAPYDGIIVTAAAPMIPEALIEQLKPGGKLVIPVGPPSSHQSLLVVEKTAGGAIETRTVLGVAFVPLTGNASQKPTKDIH